MRRKKSSNPLKQSLRDSRSFRPIHHDLQRLVFYSFWSHACCFPNNAKETVSDADKVHGSLADVVVVAAAAAAAAADAAGSTSQEVVSNTSDAGRNEKTV